MYTRWTAVWENISLPVSLQLFLLIRLGTRGPGNKVDHVSNVQHVDDIDVQCFIPRQAGAKSTLNLMKLTSPIMYFYDLHCQLTWHGKILQCTKNGLLMSTRVLWKETKILLLLSVLCGNKFIIYRFQQSNVRSGKRDFEFKINTTFLMPPPEIFTPFQRLELIFFCSPGKEWTQKTRGQLKINRYRYTTAV